MSAQGVEIGWVEGSWSWRAAAAFMVLAKSTQALVNSVALTSAW